MTRLTDEELEIAATCWNGSISSDDETSPCAKAAAEIRELLAEAERLTALSESQAMTLGVQRETMTNMLAEMLEGAIARGEVIPDAP